MVLTLGVLLKTPFYAFKYRDRHTISADILRAIDKRKQGVKKTQIMQAAKLNHYLVNKYLDLLITNGFILSEGRTYKLTSRGVEFMRNIDHEAMRLTCRR